MRRAPVYLVAFVLLGCGHRSEKDLVGHWKSSLGSDFTFTGDGSYRAIVHRNGKDTPETGSVVIHGVRVDLTLTSVNGISIADVRSRLERRGDKLTDRQKRLLPTLGKAESFDWSNDGKTLTKRKASGTPYVLQKDAD